MGVAGRKVDREIRTDEVLYFVRDIVAYNVVYYGRTEIFGAAYTDAVWQIKRVTRTGNIEETLYANVGKYNCKWSDRVSYFPAEPPYTADPGIQTHPSGLTVAGKITVVSLAAGVWTPLPAVPLVDRNALGVQNQSGTEIKLNYDPLTVGYVGILVGAGAERYYDITDDIILYAKPIAGTPSIVVEEIS